MQTVTAQVGYLSAEAPERRRPFAFLVIALGGLALASIPYITGYAAAPAGMRFLGQIFVVDDYCVYLSWTKQAADGHFFVRNLFTTDPQHGIEFNLFFFILGRFARVTHLPVDIVLQIARLFGGAGLLFAVYKLYSFLLPGDSSARTAAFAIAVFGSGIAWLHLLKDRNVSLIYPSADSAQPEAFTFTSAYFAPLMSAGTILICVSLGYLLKSVLTDKKRYAAAAGLSMLVLGNIHSYDVIHIAFAWMAFLVAWCATKRQIDWRAISLSAITGIIAAPSVLYQAYLLHHEHVFYQRAMEAATRTPGIPFYISGYGLVFILAAIGARAVLRQKPLAPGLLLTICWAVAGISSAYLVNLPFQRKLIMGEDIPLSLLAGIGTMWAARRAGPRRQKFVAAAIVLATAPSTLVFIARDMSTITHARRIIGSTPSPYLTAGEQSTLGWLATHTDANDAVVAPMRLSLLIPGYCDRFVWAAHWGETPHCIDKVRQFSSVWANTATDAQRIDFLRATRARYFCYPNSPDHRSLCETAPAGISRVYADISDNPPSYLRPVYRNSEYTVFSVCLP